MTKPAFGLPPGPREAVCTAQRLSLIGGERMIGRGAQNPSKRTVEVASAK
jgi:hypothetical protein